MCFSWQSRLIHPKYCLNGASVMGFFKRFIDILKTVELHDPVNRESSLTVIFQHLGNEYLRCSVPLNISGILP